MAGERVMWLVRNANKMPGTQRYSAVLFETEEEARAWLSGYGSNWRCSRIVVEAEGE